MNSILCVCALLSLAVFAPQKAEAGFFSNIGNAFSNAGNAVSSWVDNKLLPQSTAGCPPTGFDSLANFDVLDYISQPWYVQWQQPISYQSKDSLYCGE